MIIRFVTRLNGESLLHNLLHAFVIDTYVSLAVAAEEAEEGGHDSRKHSVHLITSR